MFVSAACLFHCSVQSQNRVPRHPPCGTYAHAAWRTGSRCVPVVYARTFAAGVCATLLVQRILQDKDTSHPEVARDMKLLNLMLRCEARVDVDAAVKRLEKLHMQGMSAAEVGGYASVAYLFAAPGPSKQPECMRHCDATDGL